MTTEVQSKQTNPWVIATIVLAVLLVLGLGWIFWMQTMCMQDMNMNSMMQSPVSTGQRDATANQSQLQPRGK